MTYDQCRMSSGWLTMLSYVIRIRSLIWWLSHPDDLAGVGISSGWLTVNSLCHPDDIPFHLMSSGWLNWAWYLIRMSYGSVIMSSGWDTLPVLSHPDEIANFDFPHHAVALQRFRNDVMLYLSINYCDENIEFLLFALLVVRYTSFKSVNHIGPTMM